MLFSLTQNGQGPCSFSPYVFFWDAELYPNGHEEHVPFLCNERVLAVFCAVCHSQVSKTQMQSLSLIAHSLAIFMAVQTGSHNKTRQEEV